MTSTSIPRTVEEISPEWLTQALRLEGVIGPTAEVASVRAEPVGVGQGFSGQLARLHLAYAGAGPDAPSSLIAKLPPTDPVRRARVIQRRIYEREIRFYEEIAGEGDIATPRRYFSAMDLAADNLILLLEDLITERVGDNVAGCSLADADLVVRSAARFQAVWWDSPRLAQLAWMPSFSDNAQTAHNSYQQSWGLFQEKFGEQLPAPFREIGAAIAPHVGWIMDRIAEPPQTIVHFDYRLDNMIFGVSEHHAPLTIIDWALALKGRGVSDIAYFLLGYTAPEQRRATEMGLLRTYHTLLAEHGVHQYGFEQCLQDYRFSMLLGMVRRVNAGAALDYSSERGRLYMEAMIQKTTAALVDHQVLELLPA